MDSLALDTKKSLFWQTFIPVTSEIIRFCFAVLIARILEPKDFGIMSIASIIILYANKLTELGFTNSLIQRKDINDNHIHAIFTINIALSMILTALTILFSNPIALYFNTPELKNVLPLLSLIFIITAFMQIPEAMLKRNLSYKSYTLVTFCGGLIQSSLALILAYRHWGYWSLAYGFVFGQLITAILLNIIAKQRFRLKINRTAAKELFSFSLWNFFMVQLSVINEYADKTIIGKLLGVTILGFYEKAYQLAIIPINSISMRINGVMFASFSRIQTDRLKLLEYFSKITLISSLINFPILFGIALISPYFVNIFLGEKWVPMIKPLNILCFAFLFRVMFGILDSLQVSAGDYKRNTRRRFIAIAISIGLCVFAAKYGIEMVAVVILMSNILMFLLSLTLAKRTFQLSCLSFSNSLLPAISNSIVMFVIGKILAVWVLTEFTLLNLFALIAVSGTIYIFLLLRVDYKILVPVRTEILSKIKNRKCFA